MYIPQAVSQKVDCYCCASQNGPSHLHVITLIEHALDNNNSLFFRSRMNILKHTCALDDKVKDKMLSFLKKAPSFVNSQLREKPQKHETHFHISIMVLIHIKCVCNAHTYVLCSSQNDPSTYPLLLQPVGADRAYLVSVPVPIVLYNITQLLCTSTSSLATRYLEYLVYLVGIYHLLLE